jgi:hypothetical protein
LGALLYLLLNWHRNHYFSLGILLIYNKYSVLAKYNHFKIYSNRRSLLHAIIISLSSRFHTHGKSMHIDISDWKMGD